MGMGMQHTPSQPQPGPTHHSNASAAAAATALHNLVSSSTVRTISRGSVQLCARVMRWHTALWWWGAWFPLPPSNELCKRGLALGGLWSACSMFVSVALLCLLAARDDARNGNHARKQKHTKGAAVTACFVQLPAQIHNT
eukprot:scaffold310794_cov19-Tisochrysis_lutea.AAC.1